MAHLILGSFAKDFIQPCAETLQLMNILWTELLPEEIDDLIRVPWILISFDVVAKDFDSEIQQINENKRAAMKWLYLDSTRDDIYKCANRALSYIKLCI